MCLQEPCMIGKKKLGGRRKTSESYDSWANCIHSSLGLETLCSWGVWLVGLTFLSLREERSGMVGSLQGALGPGKSGQAGDRELFWDLENYRLKYQLLGLIPLPDSGLIGLRQDPGISILKSSPGNANVKSRPRQPLPALKSEGGCCDSPLPAPIPAAFHAPAPPTPPPFFWLQTQRMRQSGPRCQLY